MDARTGRRSRAAAEQELVPPSDGAEEQRCLALLEGRWKVASDLAAEVSGRTLKIRTLTLRAFRKWPSPSSRFQRRRVRSTFWVLTEHFF